MESVEGKEHISMMKCCTIRLKRQSIKFVYMQTTSKKEMTRHYLRSVSLLLSLSRISRRAHGWNGIDRGECET